jgi:hypothetical protein
LKDGLVACGRMSIQHTVLIRYEVRGSKRIGHGSFKIDGVQPINTSNQSLRKYLNICSVKQNLVLPMLSTLLDSSNVSHLYLSEIPFSQSPCICISFLRQTSLESGSLRSSLVSGISCECTDPLPNNRRPLKRVIISFAQRIWWRFRATSSIKSPMQFSLFLPETIDRNQPFWYNQFVFRFSVDVEQWHWWLLR